MFKVLSLLIFILLFSFCNSPIEEVYSEVIYAGMPGKSALDTIITDSTQRITFSRLTKEQSAGLQFFYRLPTNLVNKPLYLVFEGNARTNYVQSRAAIVATVWDKDNWQLCWLVHYISPYMVNQNEWNHFKDSILLTNVFNDVKYYSIRLFPYLGDSTHEKFDVDSLKVTIKKRKGF